MMNNKILSAIVDRLAWGFLVAIGWAGGVAVAGLIPGVG